MDWSLEKVFIFGGFGFILGLFFSPITGTNYLLFFVLFLTSFVFSYLRKSSNLFLFSVFFFTFSAANYYFFLDNYSRVSILNPLVGKENNFECKVSGDVERREFKKRFFCEISFLDINQVKVSERILLYTKDIHFDFLHGDILEISALLEKPQSFKTDTGMTFDYAEYLKTRDIFWVSFDSKILNIQKADNNWRRKLFEFREFFLKSFSEKLRGQKENLFRGIIFGQNILNADLADVFRISGLTHIIALSGYNITIIAGWVKSFFYFLGAKFSALFSVISIILFILMTGVPITAVRAGIMALISLLALRTGNIYASLRALFIATLIMSIFNPRLPYFDLSFQLSVLATLGIILAVPYFNSKLSFIKISWLKEIVSTTFSAQIFVLPIILHKTGLLSVIGLPANIILLPLVPLVMIFGLLGGLIGLLFKNLSFPFVFFSEKLLGLIIDGAELGASFSFSAYKFTISWWVCVLLYIGILGFILKRFKTLTKYVF